MEISNYAEEKIKEFEGLRLTAYRCSAGKWTIGWGHTKGVRPGMTITTDEAQKFFEEDVEAVEEMLKREPYYHSLGESQRDALVSFIFNLGFGNFNSSTLRKKLMRDVEDCIIPDEFRRWVYATNPKTGKKEKLPGLVTRREWEAQMYEDL
jgi:lysozyme